MQEVYNIFGGCGMASLVPEGTNEHMKSASSDLHGSATFTTSTLSSFTLEAASDKVKDDPGLLEGMKRSRATYQHPQFMVRSTAEYPYHNEYQCPFEHNTPWYLNMPLPPYLLRPLARISTTLEDLFCTFWSNQIY